MSTDNSSLFTIEDYVKKISLGELQSTNFTIKKPKSFLDFVNSPIIFDKQILSIPATYIYVIYNDNFEVGGLYIGSTKNMKNRSNKFSISKSNTAGYPRLIATALDNNYLRGKLFYFDMTLKDYKDLEKRLIQEMSIKFNSLVINIQKNLK